jgi:WD40 repeat protein
MAYSPDGAWLAVLTRDEQILLWSQQQQAIARAVDLGGHWGTALAFSPDSRTLAYASNDRTAYLIDLATGNSRALTPHGDAILQIAFLPDSRALVTVSYDSTARIWDVATGAYRELLDHRASILAMALSADGSLLGTGGDDRPARIWSPATDPIPDAAALRAAVDRATTAEVVDGQGRVHSPAGSDR